MKSVQRNGDSTEEMQEAEENTLLQVCLKESNSTRAQTPEAWAARSAGILCKHPCRTAASLQAEQRAAQDCSEMNQGRDGGKARGRG